MGSIYFNGSELTSHTVSFNGTEMANVWFNGTKIWTSYTPSAQTFTSTGSYTINAGDRQISWKISGGGGGGGGAGGYAGAGGGSAGGTTTITVKDSGGSVRSTLGTAAGGAGGAYNGGSGGIAGDEFTAFSHSPWGGTVSDGGNGAASDIAEDGYFGGDGGAAGASASGTYTVNADGNDHSIAITIGGGGAGGGAGIPTYAVAGNSGGGYVLGIL